MYRLGFEVIAFGTGRTVQDNEWRRSERYHHHDKPECGGRVLVGQRNAPVPVDTDRRRCLGLVGPNENFTRPAGSSRCGCAGPPSGSRPAGASIDPLDSPSVKHNQRPNHHCDWKGKAGSERYTRNVQDGTDPSIQIYDEMYRNTSFHGCTDCEVPELWAAIREEFGHSPFSYDYCETGNVFRYTTQLQPIALTATRPDTTLESYLELRDDVIREQEPTTAANLTYSIQSYHTTLQTTPVVMFAKRYSKQGSKNYTDVSVQVDIPNVPVVLVLTDHGSSRWNVTISSRTNVTELVVSGLSAQQLNLLDGSIVGSQILMDRTSDKTERALNCLFCTIMDADSWSRANYNVPLFAFDYAEGATQFSYQDVKTDAPTTAPSGALSSTPSTTSSSAPSGMTQPPAAPGSSDNSKDALTPTIHKGTQTPTLAPTVDKGATEPPFRPKTTYEPTAAGLSPESSSSNLNNNSGDSKTTTLLGVAIAAMLVLVMLVLWMMRRRKYQKGTVVVELETQHEDNDIT